MAKTIFPLPGPIHSGDKAGKLSFAAGVAVEGGRTVYISGQLARNDDLQLIGKGDIRAQTRQVLENIGKILAQAGGTFADVVKVVVYVKDMSQFRAIHDVRLEFFDEDHLPASTMVQISAFTLPDALIEIEAVAVIGA